MSQRSSYFAGFVGFVPNPRSSLEIEFLRLAQHQEWFPGSSKHARERRKGVLAEYDFHFGSIDVSGNWMPGRGSVKRWYSKTASIDHAVQEGSINPSYITSRLGTEGMFVQILRSVHINLLDLIGSRRKGTKVRKFSNAEELRTYTINEDKIFPKKKTKTDGLIRIFLRGIFCIRWNVALH
ncbi:hypothetical protein MMC27_008498 [Xylographa pallens]|nr:hypothetical protein [Xylographa pallens]